MIKEKLIILAKDEGKIRKEVRNGNVRTRTALVGIRRFEKIIRSEKNGKNGKT